jgi:hypothetical protein
MSVLDEVHAERELEKPHQNPKMGVMGKVGAAQATIQQGAAATQEILKRQEPPVPKKPDASGSNYVSTNTLFVPAGTESGISHASEHVPYQKVELAGNVPDGAKQERRKLNQQRDARTRLGRGKNSVVEVK